MVKTLALTLFIIVLGGSYTTGSLAVAIAIMASSSLLAYALCKNEKHDPIGLKINHKFFIYLMYLAKEVFWSTVSVCKKIFFKKKSELRPVITKIITKQKTDEPKVLFGNSITLTPGTITIDISKNTVILHAINAECAHAAKDLDSKITQSQK